MSIVGEAEVSNCLFAILSIPCGKEPIILVELMNGNPNFDHTTAQILHSSYFFLVILRTIFKVLSILANCCFNDLLY